jgi:predicted deacylase
MSSRSDLLQLVTQSLVVTLIYKQCTAIVDLHRLQSTVAHALGFSISTSRLPAMALNTQTVRVSHSDYQIQNPSFTGALFITHAENSLELY